MHLAMKRLLVVFAAAVLCATAAVPALAAGDPYRDKQWGLDRIDSSQSWAGSRGAGVTIAVVDTGIDLTHPDLKSKIVSHVTCIDSCVTGGDDDNGHGSHVAGIAAASTSNGIGIAGVAPSAKLMAVKVLGADGRGYCSDIGLGVRWAADHGADVINLSLSPATFGLDFGCGLQAAAEYAWDKGVVVVVSAGNDGLINLYGSSKLIVVGATGPDDAPASYSNSGADIYAPGGDTGGSCNPSTCVLSTYKDGGYASIQGTSQATPHVSGIAGQLVAKGYSNSQVLGRLASTADSVHGIRRVNAARAVGASSSTPTPTKSSKPRPGSPRPPASGGSGGGGSTPTPTASSTVKPSVLPTKIAPSTSGSPTSGGVLAAPPRRRTDVSSRTGLTIGAIVLGLIAAGATLFIRRRRTL